MEGLGLACMASMKTSELSSSTRQMLVVLLLLHIICSGLSYCNGGKQCLVLSVCSKYMYMHVL